VNVPDLVSPIYRRREADFKIYPCHTNRASSLGGDCERALVYARTHWEEAAKPDISTIILLQEGDKHEREALADLGRAGFQVIEQQVALEWKVFQITGHLDAVVVHEGESIPLDVKSMSPHIWDSIFRRGPGVYPWEEVREAFQKKPWLRKYLGQITLYELFKSVDRGILLAVNKGTGALAQVNVDLDYDYGEFLLRRAERINGHVAAGTIPDRIPFDDEICPRCAHYTTCLPDHVGREPIAFLDNSIVERLLEERERNEDARKVFEAADERVKKWAKARTEAKWAIGPWLLEKKVDGRGTTIKIKRAGEPASAEKEGTHAA